MRTIRAASSDLSAKGAFAPEPPVAANARTRVVGNEGHIGNQAMLRQLSRTTPHPQCQLQVGAVNDPLELEADRVADAVMRMPSPTGAVTATSPLLRRKCDACEEEDDRLARKANSHAVALEGTAAPPIGEGQYAPGTSAGHHLPAHELAHTIQQTGSRGRARPPRNSAAPILRSGPVTLSRATVKVGNVSAEVDYGDLINVPVSAYVSTIQARFQSYAGAALDPAVVAQITAFTPQQQEWVLFALDILSENTAQAPGLDRTKAFQRLVDRAPSSTTRGLGTASFAFEREVLVTSGWAEEAISGGLTAPTATQQSVIDPLLNPPAASTAPAGGVFDDVTFKAELPALTTARLSSSVQNPALWPGTRAQPLADVQAVGNVIQARALSFFAPYAETARDNRWLAAWQYGSHISSVTTDPGGAPRTVSRADRLSLIENRATISGQNTAAGPSLFSRTNFDPSRSADQAAFDKVVSDLEADPTVQSLVNDLLRHTGVTNSQTQEVGISTEVSTATTECATRWNTIRTLCHELMHAMGHPDFFAATTSSPRFPSGVTFDQVLVEGFAEVLGVQLFSSVRTTAAGDASLLGQLTQGVTGTCTPPTTPLTLGYAAAGANAQAILNEVGDDRLRAAYFHGRVSLIGL